MANVPKRYLGDGCYVALAEGKIVLTTENGVEVTNEIVLWNQRSRRRSWSSSTG